MLSSILMGLIMIAYHMPNCDEHRLPNAEGARRREEVKHSPSNSHSRQAATARYK